MIYAPVLKYIGGWNILMIKYNLTLSIKEASMISGMPESFIRKQVENGVIPKCYSINHKYRRVFKKRKDRAGCMRRRKLRRLAGFEMRMG